MAYALVLASQPKELFRELDQSEQVFLGESIQRALTAIATQQLKPSVDPLNGHATVYLEDSGYRLTCRFLAPGEQGPRSGDAAYIVALKLIIKSPPY